MSILTATTGLSSIAGSVTSALGLDGWQLKDGKYNGCSFAVFVPIPLLSGNLLFQSGTDAVAMYNSATGGVGADPNGLGQLYQTNLGVLQFTDTMVQGKVVKKTPYTNKVNIEDTGFQGYEFGMSLLFLGDDYVKALANFEKAIATPPENPKQYMVLEHPIRGVINGLTYVVDYKVVTSLAYFNGCIVNVTFRATDTFGAIAKVPVLSTAQQIARAVNTALKLVNAIGSTVNQIQGTVKNVSNGGLLQPKTWNNLLTYSYRNITQSIESPTLLNKTEYNEIVAATQNVQDTLLNSVAYVMQYGNTNVKIAAISSLDIDYTYLPPALNQFKQYVLVQGDILLMYYTKQVDKVVALIDKYNVNKQATNLLLQLEQSKAVLSAVCNTVGNKITTNTFLTPYDMSIIKVLSLNNISLSQAKAVMDLNPNIVSSNYIKANTRINLV